MTYELIIVTIGFFKIGSFKKAVDFVGSTYVTIRVYDKTAFPKLLHEFEMMEYIETVLQASGIVPDIDRIMFECIKLEDEENGYLVLSPRAERTLEYELATYRTVTNTALVYDKQSGNVRAQQEEPNIPASCVYAHGLCRNVVCAKDWNFNSHLKLH